MKEDLKRKDSVKVEWLGGSRVLLFHYRCIGLALLEYEKMRAMILSKSCNCEKNFREAVSFVPVEVMESYLDDLLDLSTPDEKLFLDRCDSAMDLKLLFAILYGSIATLLFVLLQGRILLLMSCLIAFMAILFFPSWFHARGHAARRLMLARMLSQEINRRRGRDEGASVMLHSSFHWRQLFSSGKTSSMPGAAFELWH